MTHPHRDQAVALPTKHAKQRGIAPALVAIRGLHLTLAPLDTRVPGTFTGEAERAGLGLTAKGADLTDHLVGGGRPVVDLAR